MSSNENPDQELEQVLQTYFESEAQRLKAPAGLWARIEAGMQGDAGRGAVPPVWQRLVQRGRWGLSPVLVAVAMLAIAVSIAWLAAAGSGEDGSDRELTRIRTELEQVQGQINFLERRVDLATIIVALSPPQLQEGQPASASLALVVSDVSQRVEETKGLVTAASGEIDQISTTLRDGVERASLTVRVFAQDFDRVLSAIESQGEVERKDVQQQIIPAGPEADDSEEPGSRIVLEYAEEEEEESNGGVWIAMGSAASVVVLGFLFYVAYQYGQRRGEME